ncbi:MAG TPA: CARDB domain-containing protein, partial [Candidatus Syntrophosphaera sp.]|nr:CARDB domain-containing protein [Candidatus Syntrophosphaera sp.]
TRALKVQSDSTPYDPANPPVGTTPTGQFPKTTIFYIEQGVENDLAALNISGSTSCNVGSSYVYTITVKNNGTTTQSNYTVKLMQEGGIELGSVEGTTINTMATLQFTIPWTPSTAGETYLYGEVVLTGDENPSNNQTSHLNVTVQDSEVLSVTIGSGDQLAMVPMNFYYMNSLFECLYYPEELGFSNVTITALAFYNNFNVAVPNGTTRIWLGTTTQPNLSNGWIPSTELSLVFEGEVNYPIGTNTIIIPLQTPYMYSSGNLVMMVHRPMDTQYYSDADYFLAQTIGNNRARMAQRDIVNNFNPANPPSEFTALTGQFPKTTIFYSDRLIATDLSCLDINGNITPRAGAETQYTITVKNNGTATQSNYTVKLMQEGGVLINSVPGTPINPMQTLNFTINWTPGESGSTYIYGEVEVTGDEVITNNQTKHQNIEIYPEGMIVKTVGMGNCIGRIPILFYWKNSLTETIYLASEINGTGWITDIQYYNNFVSNLYGKPINIWMGETTLTDLSGGWIPCTQLTQVFSGTVDFPTGQNDIMIHLSTPYFYNGGNLVVMVERPWDTHYYFNPDVFILHMGTEICRTLSNASDFEDYDPANPPTDASVEDVIPVTTFIFDTSVSGTIAGT